MRDGCLKHGAAWPRLLVAGFLAAVLAACGDGGKDAPPASATGASTAPSPAPAADGASVSSAPTAAGPDATGFPLTLTTALGDAVIPAPPRRVITLGLGADDLALALGVAPVGVGRADWGGDADGYWPWVRQALERQGKPLPETIRMYPELDVEHIIALQPDLVLAPFSGMSAQAFRQLSAFVPVVGYPDAPYLTPVPTQVDLSAAALGKTEKAEAVKQGIHDALAQAAHKWPMLQGKSFAYVRADLGSGNFAAYVPGDPRVDTLSAMGLTLAPAVRGLRASGGHFAHYLGFEHADRLADVDVLVSWFYNAQERDKVAAVPLFASIPAVRRGAYVALDDPGLVMASSSGAPLAIAWMLDRLGPQLAQAAERASSP